jgi:predicted nucleic-acid-binding protein
MKITVDTNVLVRAVVKDDLRQSKKAIKILKEASMIAVSLTSLCELVWVLLRLYKIPVEEVLNAIKVLISAQNVEVNRLAVEVGLRQLEEGGDFADAVIAYEGKWLGAETFVTLDKKAVDILKKHHQSAVLF